MLRLRNQATGKLTQHLGPQFHAVGSLRRRKTLQSKHPVRHFVPRHSMSTLLEYRGFVERGGRREHHESDRPKRRAAG
jgi:hypothetical protein